MSGFVSRHDELKVAKANICFVLLFAFILMFYQGILWLELGPILRPLRMAVDAALVSRLSEFQTSKWIETTSDGICLPG